MTRTFIFRECDDVIRTETIDNDMLDTEVIMRHTRVDIEDENVMCGNYIVDNVVILRYDTANFGTFDIFQLKAEVTARINITA